jgi:lipase ATG15
MEKQGTVPGPTTAQLLARSSKAWIFLKVLLLLSLLASTCCLIYGRWSNIVCVSPVPFRGYWHPLWCPRPQQPLKRFPSRGQDEFRLVSVHRAGVGKRRNQVYQVFDIPRDSTLHSFSALSTTPHKYNVSSTIRKSTHLADRSRENILKYLAHSRLSAQARREPLNTALRNTHLRSFSDEWTTEDVTAPNITDMDTILTLAKVASNAYIRIPDTEDWYDLGEKWNESTDFGWEANGLRGHVFANSDNSTIIVAMKGTSPPFVGGSDTSTNDKINVSITKS